MPAGTRTQPQRLVQLVWSHHEFYHHLHELWVHAVPTTASPPLDLLQKPMVPCVWPLTDSEQIAVGFTAGLII